jgi:hypothetical protein
LEWHVWVAPILTTPGGGGELDATVRAGHSREGRVFCLVVGGGLHPSREDQRVTHSQAAPSGSRASEGLRDPPHQDDLPKRLAE